MADEQWLVDMRNWIREVCASLRARAHSVAAYPAPTRNGVLVDQQFGLEHAPRFRELVDAWWLQAMQSPQAEKLEIWQKIPGPTRLITNKATTNRVHVVTRGEYMPVHTMLLSAQYQWSLRETGSFVEINRVSTVSYCAGYPYRHGGTLACCLDEELWLLMTLAETFTPVNAKDLRRHPYFMVALRQFHLDDAWDVACREWAPLPSEFDITALQTAAFAYLWFQTWSAGARAEFERLIAELRASELSQVFGYKENVATRSSS